MRHILLGLTLTLAALLPVRAEIKLPAILSSHMVLQREMPVAIWGTAEPGEKVAVKFRNQGASTEADKDGKWAVKLAPLKAGGGPAMMTIQGKNTIMLEDVLLGEVWVGSGQSNMSEPSSAFAAGDPVLAKNIECAPYPEIRLALATGGWKVADKTNATGFSALLLSFGLKLHQELGVPVGLMCGAAGATPSGAWLTEDMFKDDALCQAQVEKAIPKYNPTKGNDEYKEAMTKWENARARARDEGGVFGSYYAVHIKPMVPFTARGILWDQGESGVMVSGCDQFAVMGALIKGWRKAWGLDLPFLCVQKPSGGGPAFDPKDPVTSKADDFTPLPPSVPADNEDLWAPYLKLIQHPKVFLVTASDLGPLVHPTNKSGYGSRAARVALGGIYGKKVEIYGPIYKTHVVEGSKLRVTFTHVGGGLTLKHGDSLQGFALAGPDRKFYWADAVIAGQSVVVSCPQISQPVAVRYAWAERHPWANLFNADGLPALPFKADD